jgi:DNA primase
MRATLVSPLDAREVKFRADFFSIASRYTRLRRAGQQFVGLCPFHSERHASCYVHPEKKIFYCFGCGAGGDLFDFVMKAEGCDFSKALRIVSSGIGFSAEGPKAPEQGRAVFARPKHIDGKTEVRERSFSPANRWPSVEDCAAERVLFTCQKPDNP